MKITIRVSNPLYKSRHLYASNVCITEYDDFFGEVVSSPKSGNTVLLRDPYSGFVREINKDRILCGWRH